MSIHIPHLLQAKALSMTSSETHVPLKTPTTSSLMSFACTLLRLLIGSTGQAETQMPQPTHSDRICFSNSEYRPGRISPFMDKHVFIDPFALRSLGWQEYASLGFHLIETGIKPQIFEQFLAKFVRIRLKQRRNPRHGLQAVKHCSEQVIRDGYHLTPGGSDLPSCHAVAQPGRNVIELARKVWIDIHPGAP